MLLHAIAGYNAKLFFLPECSFLLANSQLWDWPIVYASDGFCYVTGISRSEIIAQSCVCEFMHGHETDQDTVEKFRKALREEKPGPIEIELCNREGETQSVHVLLFFVFK